MKKGLTLLILLVALSIAACGGTSEGVEPEDIQIQMMTAKGAYYGVKTDQDGPDYFYVYSELGDTLESYEVSITYTEDGFTFIVTTSDGELEVVKSGDTMTINGEEVEILVDGELASIGLKNSDFVSVAVGSKHSCAARSSGVVYCWGDNSNGQLGASTESDASSSPVMVDGLDHVDSLVAAGDKTCALRSNRTVWCWGDGDSKATFVDGLSGIVDVDIDVDSGVYGVVSYGEIVHSELSGKVGQVGIVGDVVDVAVADVAGVGTIVYAVIEDGQLWSDGYYIDGFNDIVRVVAYGDEVCGIQTGGDVYCSVHESGVVKKLDNASNVKEMVAGEVSVCKITSDNALSCCGWKEPDGPKPVGLTNVISASTYMDHTCAVDSGKVFCWGFNTHGEKGNGTTDDHTTPTEIKF